MMPAVNSGRLNLLQLISQRYGAASLAVVSLGEAVNLITTSS
jgi:hypothetical protein